MARKADGNIQNYPTIRLLLDVGADPNSVDEDDNASVHVIVRFSHDFMDPAVRLLWKTGVIFPYENQQSFYLYTVGLFSKRNRRTEKKNDEGTYQQSESTDNYRNRLFPNILFSYIRQLQRGERSMVRHFALYSRSKGPLVRSNTFILDISLKRWTLWDQNAFRAAVWPSSDHIDKVSALGLVRFRNHHTWHFDFDNSGDMWNECRWKCVSNSECSPSTSCFNLKCPDPCRETCGSSVTCAEPPWTIIGFSCPPGTTGDPLTTVLRPVRNFEECLRNESFKYYFKTQFHIFIQ